MIAAPNPFLPPLAAPAPLQFPADPPLTPSQRLFLQAWVEVLKRGDDVRFADWFDPPYPAQLAAVHQGVQDWFDNPYRLIQLPPTRTITQWVTWLRAEGFLDEPYGYLDVRAFDT
jgi:hypothetical protein